MTGPFKIYLDKTSAVRRCGEPNRARMGLPQFAPARRLESGQRLAPLSYLSLSLPSTTFPIIIYVQLMAGSRKSRKEKAAARTSGKSDQRDVAAPRVPAAQRANNLAELQAAAEANQAANMLAKSTRDNYDGYIKRGREWLESVVAMSRGTDLVMMDTDGTPVDLDEFGRAFDKPPNCYSGLALHLFLVDKCVNEGRGIGTCENTYSAFKNLWEMM